MKMFTSMRTWAIGCYPKVFFTKLCACSFTKKWYYYRCSVVNLGKYFRTDITNKQLPLLLQTADLNFSHQGNNIYVCVCLRPSTVKASSVWKTETAREQINDVVLKTWDSSAGSLHLYFGMQYLTFQLAALSCSYTRSGHSHDLTSIRLAFRT